MHWYFLLEKCVICFCFFCFSYFQLILSKSANCCYTFTEPATTNGFELSFHYEQKMVCDEFVQFWKVISIIADCLSRNRQSRSICDGSTMRLPLIGIRGPEISNSKSVWTAEWRSTPPPPPPIKKNKKRCCENYWHRDLCFKMHYHVPRVEQSIFPLHFWRKT